MMNGFVGEIFKFIGATVVSFSFVIPLMKICMSKNNKMHKKNKQSRNIKNKEDKQWFYDVA